MAFYSFEGPEAAGKSTVIKLVEEKLTNRGCTVFVTREPGGTKKAETIRSTIMQHDYNPLTELLLFNAARVENFYENIQPRVERGEIVLCDRYIDSTFVYQFMTQGKSIQTAMKLNSLLFKDTNMPARTYLLDISLDTLKKRLSGRGKENRFDEMGMEFHQNVIGAYRALSVMHDRRIRMIDAEVTPEEICGKIVKDILKQENGGIEL